MATVGVAADPAAVLLFTAGTLDPATQAVSWVYKVRGLGACAWRL